jgi:hypothetical protein
MLGEMRRCDQPPTVAAVLEGSDSLMLDSTA